MKEYKLTRRRLLGLLGMGALGTALGACAPAAQPTPEPAKPTAAAVTAPTATAVEPTVAVPTPAAQKVEIEFVYHFWPGWKEAMAQIVEKFQAKYPDTVLTYTPVDFASLETVLTPRFAANDAPCLTEGDSQFSWVRQHQMLDLTPLMEGDGIKIEEAYLKAGTILDDPAHYGMPMFLCGYLVYYNKSLFDKYGVSYPAQAWTYDDLHEMAITLTRDKAGKSPRDAGFDVNNIQTYGLGFSHPLGWDSVFKAFGGRVWSDDWKTCLYDDPGTIKAWEYLHELACQYHAIIPPQTTPGAANPFVSQGLGVSFDGDWMLSLFQQIPDFDWDVAAQPQGPGGQWEYAGSNTLGISAQCKHIKEAWEFEKYFVLDKEAQTLVGTSIGPYLPEVALSEDFLRGKLGKRGPTLENLRLAYDMMHKHPSGDMFCQGTRTDEWVPIASDTQNSLLVLCDKDVEPLLKETARRITEILQRKD